MMVGARRPVLVTQIDRPGSGTVDLAFWDLRGWVSAHRPPDVGVRKDAEPLGGMERAPRSRFLMMRWEAVPLVDVGVNRRVLVILVRGTRTCRAADLAGPLGGNTERDGKTPAFIPTCEMASNLPICVEGVFWFTRI